MERFGLAESLGVAASSVAFLLADLGVTKSHSRPHTSNDNPYSEAAFRTLKYRPDFPERFTSIEHARSFCRALVEWYNHEHRHVGIGLLTPASIHHGRAAEIYAARQTVLHAAYRANPKRFVRRIPQPPALPNIAYINPPEALNSLIS